MAKNLTVGSPLRLITVFMLPILVGNLFQQAYFVADTIVVGRLIGLEALAAVGASGSLQFLLFGFALGTCSGLAIPVARAYGSGDMETMRRNVATGAIIALVVGVVVTLVGTLGAGALLRLLGTPAPLMDDATVFLTVFFAGTLATVGFNYLSAVIRALGDARTPLYFLIFASLLNIGLVIAFIGGLGMGLEGAALATVVSQCVTVLLCLALVHFRMPHLHLRREDWRIVPRELRESGKLGLTMGFQISIIAVGAALLQVGINSLGTGAVAAATTALRVDNVAVSPFMSLGVAMVTYTAQNAGARQWARVRQGVRTALFLAFALAAATGVLIFFFGTHLVEVFLGAGEPAVVEMAHRYLVVNAGLYCFLGILFVIRNTIQGLGSTVAPTMAGVLELVARAAMGLWIVPLTGFTGVILAAPAAWLLALIPLGIAWRYHRRRLAAAEAAQLAHPDGGWPKA